MDKTIHRKEDGTMSKRTDLTQGSIIPQLTRLCIPLLAANLLQQLYNIINSLVVTHYLGHHLFRFTTKSCNCTCIYKFHQLIR